MKMIFKGKRMSINGTNIRIPEGICICKNNKEKNPWKGGYLIFATEEASGEIQDEFVKKIKNAGLRVREDDDLKVEYCNGIVGKG